MMDLADIAEIFPLYRLLAESEWMCNVYMEDKGDTCNWQSRAMLSVIEPYLLEWFNRDDEPPHKDRLFGEVKSVVEAYDPPYPVAIERDLIRSMLCEVRRRRAAWILKDRRDGFSPGHPLSVIRAFSVDEYFAVFDWRSGLKTDPLKEEVRTWCLDATRELHRARSRAGRI